ncbi:hypothetical protein BC936DRAFT_147623 [Jimgerdemannia flammicorona]|uniref:F-box domain-containing protein n=1 Tax=Jimgerdemannia flammicorona TaxID=994334 RepID=A0A433DKY7_9FUNG|nr:hypothetical protein BC936DRAFT_147623 [Jimgerdemannia flammicorona]
MGPPCFHPFNDNYLPSEIIEKIVQYLPGHLLFELKDICVALSEPCRDCLFKYAYKLGLVPLCAPKFPLLEKVDNDPLGWRREAPWGMCSGLFACKRSVNNVYEHMALSVRDLFHIAGSKGNERGVREMWDVISVLHLDEEALFSQVVKDFHEVLDIGGKPSQIALWNAYIESEYYDRNVGFQINANFQIYINSLYNRYYVQYRGGSRPPFNERVETCLIGNDAIFRNIGRYRVMLARFWALRHQLFPFDYDENRAWFDRRRDMVEDLEKYEAVSAKPFVNECQRRMWCAKWKAERDGSDKPVEGVKKSLAEQKWEKRKEEVSKQLKIEQEREESRKKRIEQKKNQSKKKSTSTSTSVVEIKGESSKHKGKKKKNWVRPLKPTSDK